MHHCIYFDDNSLHKRKVHWYFISGTVNWIDTKSTPVHKWWVRFFWKISKVNSKMFLKAYRCVLPSLKISGYPHLVENHLVENNLIEKSFGRIFSVEFFLSKNFPFTKNSEVTFLSVFVNFFFRLNKKFDQKNSTKKFRSNDLSTKWFSTKRNSVNLYRPKNFSPIIFENTNFDFWEFSK